MVRRKQARLNQDWKHVPILMVSADFCRGEIERALALGANDYMVRTTGIKTQVQKVNGLLPSSSSKSRNMGSDDRVRPATATPVPRRRKARARRSTSSSDRKGGAK